MVVRVQGGGRASHGGAGKEAGSSRAPRAHRSTRTRDHRTAAHESQNAVPNLARRPDEKRPQRSEILLELTGKL
ncbi:unnamed protein product [Colias eurytheme]|nr:unnamed protein product [Colias eurytheme]